MYGICSSLGHFIPFYANILCSFEWPWSVSCHFAVRDLKRELLRRTDSRCWYQVCVAARHFAPFNICGRSRNAKWWLLRLLPGCGSNWQVYSRSLPPLHARTIPYCSIMKCRPGCPGAVSGVFASVHPAGRPLLPAACMLTAPPGAGAGRKGGNVELGLINETHVGVTDKTPTINPWKWNVAII